MQHIKWKLSNQGMVICSKAWKAWRHCCMAKKSALFWREKNSTEISSCSGELKNWELASKGEVNILGVWELLILCNAEGKSILWVSAPGRCSKSAPQHLSIWASEHPSIWASEHLSIRVPEHLSLVLNQFFGLPASSRLTNPWNSWWCDECMFFTQHL